MKTLSDLPIKPLDLLLFRGFDPVSHTIQFVQNREIGRGDFSHAGLVVTREALDLPCLEPGRIYVWESVLSAKEGFWANFSDGIPDVDENRVRFGVQIRDLELVIPGYYEAGGQVAWCRLRDELPPREVMRSELMALYEQYGHARFPVNLLNFCSVVFPALRSERDRLNRAQDKGVNVINRLLARTGKAASVPDAEHHIFCSEWCARVYERLDILKVPDPRLVAPMHFLTITNKFEQPVPIVPEGFDPAKAAKVSTAPSSAPREDAPRRRARAAGAAFLRHYSLQERLREFAQERAPSVGLSENGRINIDFGELDAEDARAAEGCLETDTALDLRRGAAPIAVGGELQPLSIAVLVAGTREEVEPFIVIGKRLQRDGHRVRVATHAVFREFVESNGLEFYPLGGDPKELIEYMVRTGGKVLPTRVDQLVEDAPKQRNILGEIIESTWGACTKEDPEHQESEPFTADAIISNPPTHGHIHVAEALSVPLHMVFTMPWTPTRAFPHALANLDFESDGGLKNYLSYGVVDSITWACTSDLIARFRKKTLGLPALGIGKGAGLLNDANVPFCYLWSPSLVARPDDWGDHVDVAEFVFYEESGDYEPPADLVSFLEAGDPPIYVGFGSCVVENPEEVTQTIFAALKAAGRRGIVAEGWAGLGSSTVPEHVHVIGDCPHDWLFPRCAAVCHHGGASTTAMGTRAGRPTVVVPFFGDQPFWGARVARAGAGPKPVPIRELTVERLADAFRACDSPEMAARAAEIGETLQSHDGAELAVQAFYRHLPTTGHGIAAYLGFSAEDRQRMAAGEIVTRQLEEGSTAKLGFALAARIERPLEDIYAACTEGAPIENNPNALAFGKLGDRDATAADFGAAGYTAAESAEAGALLQAEPGGPFNLALEEIERFRDLRKRFSEKTPSAEALAAVNETVRDLLLQRYNAYRHGGIDAIAHYARDRGEAIRPADLFRVALPPDSMGAHELPDLVRALIDYPNNDFELDSRFFWTKDTVDGHPTFSLAHHMHFLGAGLAVLALRWFYIGRDIDVKQVVVALLPDDGSTVLICAHRDIGTHVAGVAAANLRSRIRNQMESTARSVVESLRSPSSSSRAA